MRSSKKNRERVVHHAIGLVADLLILARRRLRDFSGIEIAAVVVLAMIPLLKTLSGAIWAPNHVRPIAGPVALLIAVFFFCFAQSVRVRTDSCHDKIMASGTKALPVPAKVLCLPGFWWAFSGLFFFTCLLSLAAAIVVIDYTYIPMNNNDAYLFIPLWLPEIIQEFILKSADGESYQGTRFTAVISDPDQLADLVVQHARLQSTATALLILFLHIVSVGSAAVGMAFMTSGKSATQLNIEWFQAEP